MTGTTSVIVSLLIVVTIGSEIGLSSLWSDRYIDSIDKADERAAEISAGFSRATVMVDGCKVKSSVTVVIDRPQTSEELYHNLVRHF